MLDKLKRLVSHPEKPEAPRSKRKQKPNPEDPWEGSAAP